MNRLDLLPKIILLLIILYLLLYHFGNVSLQTQDSKFPFHHNHQFCEAILNAIRLNDSLLQMIMNRKIRCDHINDPVQIDTFTDHILKLLTHFPLTVTIFPEQLLQLPDHSHALQLLCRFPMIGQYIRIVPDIFLFLGLLYICKNISFISAFQRQQMSSFFAFQNDPDIFIRHPGNLFYLCNGSYFK